VPDLQQVLQKEEYTILQAVRISVGLITMNHVAADSLSASATRSGEEAGQTGGLLGKLAVPDDLLEAAFTGAVRAASLLGC
jgi:hypothetical protein